MNDTVMDLSVLQLSLAYVFVLVLLVIFKARGIKREKQILIATTRMTIQLTVMGYILMYVFQNPSWWLTLLMIFIMVGFAIFNSIKRVKTAMSQPLKRLVAISMVFGFAATAAVFIVGVLQVRPWFNPQYFIPISGMIVGNSMTGISLGANKLC
ncbi:ABC transporter permease, partial [Hydrogenoanaerobacterium sp.]|uniref:ABC transporter permease n=1 Tax=Hydrogenoanaerobacterium sp. TaxID=2953763 RepID=UPI002897D4E6